jgi:hypothetical protein
MNGRQLGIKRATLLVDGKLLEAYFGRPRNLSQTLEAVDICIANRKLQAGARLFAR